LENLFLSERHHVSGRCGTFEDDGTSAWLYLSEADSPRVIADAWVYNRVPAPLPSRVGSYRPGPPPAAQGFAGPEALCEEPSVYRWSLRWSSDGESVAVLRDGYALAFIARASKRGYSRMLATSGPWGSVWNEYVYRQVMALSE
jgi:hypothetical protein